MHNYSDAGQDNWVIKNFLSDVIRPGYQGFFIEAGAADGLGGSNTYRLEKEYGWNGLLVEPNSYFYSQLISNRSVHCRKCVLSDSDGDIEFIEAGYFGVAPSHVKEVFDRRGLDISAHENYQLDADRRVARSSVIPARRLETILTEISAPDIIDYLSLDVEGGELFVLKGFPWEKRRIRAITVEVRFQHDGVFYDHDHRGPVHELLTRQGLSFIGSLDIDDCFCDAALACGPFPFQIEGRA